MVLILDGSPEYGEQAWRLPGSYICVKHLITSTAATNFKSLKERVLLATSASCYELS